MTLIMSTTWSSSLHASAIRAALSASVQAHLRHIEICEQVASTNDILHAKAPDTGFWVQIARNQSGARGRQGRGWEMSGGSLCFSVLHHWPDAPPPALTLWVGIALAKHLQGLGLRQPCLSWPNDLVYGEAKFGGILTECRRGVGSARCVIGVGVNVTQVPRLDCPATSLEVHNNELPEPNDLTAALIDAVCGCLLQLDAGVPASLPESFARYDGLSGCAVNIVEPHQNYTGYARGVDVRGYLQVEGSDGLRCFDSADVRLIRS